MKNARGERRTGLMKRRTAVILAAIGVAVVIAATWSGIAYAHRGDPAAIPGGAAGDRLVSCLGADRGALGTADERRALFAEPAAWSCLLKPGVGDDLRRATLQHVFAPDSGLAVTDLERWVEAQPLPAGFDPSSDAADGAAMRMAEDLGILLAGTDRGIPKDPYAATDLAAYKTNRQTALAIAVYRHFHGGDVPGYDEYIAAHDLSAEPSKDARFYNHERDDGTALGDSLYALERQIDRTRDDRLQKD
jgi:hypothetical protein